MARFPDNPKLMMFFANYLLGTAKDAQGAQTHLQLAQKTDPSLPVGYSIYAAQQLARELHKGRELRTCRLKRRVVETIMHQALLVSIAVPSLIEVTASCDGVVAIDRNTSVLSMSSIWVQHCRCGLMYCKSLSTTSRPALTANYQCLMCGIADGDALDLVSYVEYQRNYRQVSFSWDWTSTMTTAAVVWNQHYSLLHNNRAASFALGAQTAVTLISLCCFQLAH